MKDKLIDIFNFRIGTEEEAQAARTIAERGVMLIATAHGNTLENLIKNPTLLSLLLNNPLTNSVVALSLCWLLKSNINLCNFFTHSLVCNINEYFSIK